MAGNSRNDYRRRRRRKRRRKAIASLFAILIMIGAVVAAVTVFFKVSGIDVTGSTLYTAEEIIAASEIYIGDNMFAINKFDVANRLLKKFPYIGEIKIRRRLPDTFAFEIRERKRAAFFQHEKFRWLIDKDGYILEGVPPQQELNVPLIADLSLVAPSAGTRISIGEDESVYSIVALLTALEKGGLIEKCGQINVGKLYNLVFTYDNRFLIEIGSTEELDAKIRMLNSVLEQLEITDRGIINVADPKQARFRPNSDVNLNLVQNTGQAATEEPVNSPEGEGSAEPTEESAAQAEAEKPDEEKAEENKENE